MSGPTVSRYDPATWRRHDLRHAARLWNLNLMRAVGLTPTQRNLAFVIGQDTLARGFLFCVYDSLEHLICEQAGAPPLLELSKGNVSEALCGFSTSAEHEASDRRAAGLEGLGIVRVEWTHFEGQRRWIISPVPDAQQWRCDMVSVERLRRRSHVMDEAARRFSPHLPGADFAPHPDLNDALPVVQAGER